MSDCQFYDVQVTTDIGETVLVQAYADSPQHAELTAILMVESGDADTIGRAVIDCFALE